MSNYQIISEEPVSNSESFDLINQKAKKQELTYREEKSKEYLKKVSTLSFKNFKSAKKELVELKIPRLEEAHIIKILDIMPKNGTEIRSIVSNSGTVIVDDNVKKILSVLNNYAKDK